MNSTVVPPSARYLGADRSGAEFWLSGPHVLSVSADGFRTRRVCAIARFNRRGNRRCGNRSARRNARR